VRFGGVGWGGCRVAWGGYSVGGVVSWYVFGGVVARDGRLGVMMRCGVGW